MNGIKLLTFSNIRVYNKKNSLKKSNALLKIPKY